MQKTVGYFILAPLLMLTIQLAIAAEKQEIKGKHLTNSLSCEDCHGVTTPAKAAFEDACIGCHGDMVDSEWIIFEEKGHKYEHSPHDSHESPINCTECHAVHKPAKLYCNSCHEFNIKVP